MPFDTGLVVISSQQWETDNLLIILWFTSCSLIPTLVDCICQRCCTSVVFFLYVTCRRLCLCPHGMWAEHCRTSQKCQACTPGSRTLPLGTSHHAARKPNQPAAVWRRQSSYSPRHPPAVSCPVALAFKSSQLSESERNVHCRAHEHSIGCITLPTHQGHLPGERRWTLPSGRQPGAQNVLSKGSRGTFNDEPHGAPCGVPWVPVLIVWWV